MFGSLNTLFTGLAFIGLVYTIVLQKLNALDEEKERKRQQFEATLFQLLRSAESIVEGVEYHRDQRTIRGRDAFTFYYNQLYGQIDIERHKSKNDALTVVQSVYSNFYRNHQTTLGHYYRTFYHVFKYISLSCPENKTFYAHLVRAQLSNQQVLLLFYNGFDSVGHGFKRYIEEFALLKHLPRDQIYDPSLLKNYNPSAYGI